MTLCEFDTPIVHHGLKLSRHGRASGGLLIYVKKCISKFVKHVGNFDCGIVLEIMEELFGQPVIYIACYLPPDRSKFYNSLQTDGVSILEQKLCEIKAMYPDHQFIVSGDFNALQRIKMISFLMTQQITFHCLHFTPQTIFVCLGNQKI